MLRPLLIATFAICRIIDGDTLVINNEHIRLIGIDAPEIHGCKKSGCVAGDPIKSKQSLENFVRNKPIKIKRFGNDKFGRTLAIITVNGQDASCHQIKTGNAKYIAKWDKGINCKN